MALAAWERGERAAGRLLLTLVLTLGLALPASVARNLVAPLVEESEEATAYAAVGSTDYSLLFRIDQKAGSPGFASGGTVRVASTASTAHYEYVGAISGNTFPWESSSFFMSNNSVPLTFDWSVSFSASFSDMRFIQETHSFLVHRVQVGLSSVNSSALITGPGIFLAINRHAYGESGINCLLRTDVYKNGFGTGATGVDVGATRAPTMPATLDYDYSSDRLSLTMGGVTNHIDNCRSYGAQQYLYFGGRIQWKNKEDDTADKHPANNEISIDFNSVTLPHFTPAVKDIVVYDAATGKVISSEDSVRPGTRVRVVCQVWNSNSAAGSEQFPVHVKQANSLVNNFTPDASKKVKVNGKEVAESLTSGDGVAVQLTGRNVVSIEYEGTVGADLKKATTVGYTMTDDIFKSADSQQRTLLEASNLVQGPDNPGSSGLKPGSEYHYTRLPQPNANGWNNTPVTVSFFAGDYSTFTISPLADTPVVLTGTSDWTKSDDVDNLTLTYQASSGAGIPSTKASDVMRIDQAAPRISLDRATKTLTVDDGAASRAAGVSSGVWKLYATDASGTPTSTLNTFALTVGKGEVTQSVPNVTEGYYMAEDAAGNRSAVFQVRDSSAPSAGRPEGSGLPAPESPSETTDGAGLKHVVYEETITQVVDADNPAFGGALDLGDAKAVAGERWTFASADGDALTGTTELLDAAGTAPIASLPTDVPGECVIRTTATDGEGNTATAIIHYRFVAPQIPTLTPQGPSDPNDPDSPKVPTGDAVKPPVPPTLGPGGTQSGELSVSVQERVREGSLPAADAASVLTEHFALGSVAGDEPTVTVDGATDAEGNPVDTIDLAVPATYHVEYTLTDAAGNTTKVHLTYVLQESVTPPDPPGPVDPVDPNPPANPGPPADPKPDDPEPPEPSTPDASKPTPAPPTVTVVPDDGGAPTVLKPTPSTVTPGSDGRTHSVVTDELVVGTRDVRMAPDDFAALFARRYQVASAQSDGKLAAGEVAIYDAAGNRIQEVDRSREGRYVVEQVFTDSAGNTTTVRLTYLVRDESAVGGLNGGDGSNGANGGGGAGAATGVSASPLPQTGPFGTLCPLHPLFVALAAVAALYTAVRLRQEAASRGRLKSREAWVRDQVLEGDAAEVAMARAIWGDPEGFAPEARWRADDASAARRLRLSALDGAVLGLVAVAALAIALAPQCPFDGPLALVVCGLSVLCLGMIQLSLGSTARTRRRCWLVEWARESGLL